ncbi:hypothetical protein B7486_54380, partial [cyanobacterium TDX16]
TANVADVVGDPTDNGDLDPDGEPAGESLFSGTDGLQVVFAVCSGGTWTIPATDAVAVPDSGDAGDLADGVTCSGTIVEQAEQPLGTFGFTGTLTAADFGVAPTATGTIPDGSTMEVLLQFRLPTTADNAYENASVAFDIEFDAIQRDGVNR